MVTIAFRVLSFSVGRCLADGKDFGGGRRSGHTAAESRDFDISRADVAQEALKGSCSGCATLCAEF